MPQAGKKGLVGTVCGWNKPEGATLMEICDWAQSYIDQTRILASPLIDVWALCVWFSWRQL